MGTSDPGALYLTIDQGSHASRALVFDAALDTVAQSKCVVATQRPHSGWVEHDSEELLASVKTVIQQVCTDLGPDLDRLKVAALATQRSSIVCWDRRTGQALSPVISWQDVRASAELGPLLEQPARVRAITGLRPSPHYGASKIRWCIEQLPVVKSALNADRLAVGPLASFLAFRLCREQPYVVDPCNASRTLLWDFQSGDWSSWMLQRMGLEQLSLPRCVNNQHPFGCLMETPAAIPLLLMTGDASAVPFAMGGLLEHRASVQFGTGAFIQRAVDSASQIDPRLLASVLWRDDHGVTLVAEGTVNGCSSAVHLLADELGLSREQVKHDGLHLIASDSDLPIYLNGVGGLGSPDWLADFESRFVGTGDHWQQLAAVHESAVFLVQRNLELMATGLREIVVSGGLGRNDPLCQCLADVSGLPVVRPAIEEATARGLAVILTGHCPAVEQTVFAPRESPQLLARYRRWRELMPAMDA